VLFGSADSTGFRTLQALGRRASGERRHGQDVRIGICDNTEESNIVVRKCRGPKWDSLRSGVPETRTKRTSEPATRPRRIYFPERPSARVLIRKAQNHNAACQRTAAPGKGATWLDWVAIVDVTYILQDLRWPALSDTCVPCVPIFRREHARAQAFAELFDVISDREAGDVFDVLVAELTGNAHAQRPAEWHRQFAAVHTVGDESLRVHRLSHVDAIPSVGLDRTVYNVSGLGQRPHPFQDV